MNIGDRIREKRKAAGLTQAQLAEYFDISSVSVSEWERGDSKPEQGKLVPLARILKTSVGYLLTGKETGLITTLMDLTGQDAYAEAEKIKGKLPLISWVQAGEWSEIGDAFQPGDAEDWIPCPFNHGPNAFILRVAGFSMHNPGGEKSYAPGEFIAVDPRVEPQNRKMVVARLNDEEKATFKQLLIEPDGTHLLQALNPAWPNRITPMPENSRIVGVVIGKWTPE